MQNSEMYRRGFVVPLNKLAEQALLNNNVGKETNVAYFEIPNDHVFESLWSKGLFNDINTGIGSMIDDYEEEIIEFIKIEKVIEIVQRFKNEKKLDAQEATVVTALNELLRVASERKFSFFFIM